MSETLLLTKPLTCPGCAVTTQSTFHQSSRCWLGRCLRVCTACGLIHIVVRGEKTEPLTKADREIIRKSGDTPLKRYHDQVVEGMVG